MGKLLEKLLRDSRKESKLTLGTKEVQNSLKNSNLVVLSQSVQKNTLDNIQQNAKKSKIPTVNFEGTSIALGKLCGLQFRVSTVSFSSLSDATVKSIVKESNTK